MSFEENMIPQNRDMREFDILQREYLGDYIYALIDPRDNKVFYIGQSQGNSNRVFDHFNEAEDYLKGNLKMLSSKVLRIIDIWMNEEDVKWAIVACKVNENSNTLDLVESALIDLLPLSQNGPALNAISGHNSSAMTKEELEDIAAEKINPLEGYETVFIFPINTSLAKIDMNMEASIRLYEATRSAWYVKDSYRVKNNAKAVGLVNNISKSAYNINSWHDDANSHKHYFEGTVNPDIQSKNWIEIIKRAKGYWQRGNYLIVEFNGSGQFRFLRGNPDKKWFDLV